MKLLEVLSPSLSLQSRSVQVTLVLSALLMAGTASAGERRIGNHIVKGAILDAYDSLDMRTRATLGAPRDPEFCGLVDGGCGQHFQKGSIYFSPKTGAHKVWGQIREAWKKMGWENSPIGYPISPEYCGLRGRGCFQRFSKANGHIYWTGKTGAHAVRGLIFDKYARSGYENGTCGYPIGDEQQNNDYWFQYFEGCTLRANKR